MAVTYEYVGKTGGGGKPATIPITNPKDITVQLPDGEWCVTLQAARFTGSQGTNRLRLYENSVLVTDAGGSNVSEAGTGVACIRRHMQGTLNYTSPNIDIISVVAFPDPS